MGAWVIINLNGSTPNLSIYDGTNWVDGFSGGNLKYWDGSAWQMVQTGALKYWDENASGTTTTTDGPTTTTTDGPTTTTTNAPTTTTTNAPTTTTTFAP